MLKSDQFHFIKEQLLRISEEHGIQLRNLDEVLYVLIGSAYFEAGDPQSGSILYHRNEYFAEDISTEFPNFYQDLYGALKTLRQMMGKPITKNGLGFYIYTVFNWWKNLVPELRRKLAKIRVLVISDRHTTNASMLKDFIEYEFSEQLVIDYYGELNFNIERIKEMNYDLIVSSFTIPKLDRMRHVYIPNLPKFQHYLEINKHINAIVLDRIKK